MVISNNIFVKTFILVECYDCVGSNCTSENLLQSRMTCDSSCWSISFVDFALGLVHEEYGCAESSCGDTYSHPNCFQGDARNSGLVCIKCCKGHLCNDSPLDLIEILPEVTVLRKSSAKLPIFAFILFIINLL